jgi:hypothetical protein
MSGILNSLKFRFFNNVKTSIGGGTFGVVLAALFAKFEEMSGCRLSEVLPNIDWGQLFVFGISQLFGLYVTDADKVIDANNSNINK